ncbi:hypothetical protein ILUMI_01932 [Ignelater luminosus]|uniref:G domain-containing protein n=1 Tax=Ignelater luminosus TaxID=2038154 RepID=A0A8K0DJ34_IGNLU|nr:hypothetical protein ILUMI_01932 [Ignelater luminosus]
MTDRGDPSAEAVMIEHEMLLALKELIPKDAASCGQSQNFEHIFVSNLHVRLKNVTMAVTSVYSLSIFLFVPVNMLAITEADTVMAVQTPQTKKEFIILLLGETGVGKSTFINAFANYLTYLNLSEAVNDELINLIPSKFTVTDENYEERTIRIGQCENESENVGASATQNAKSYVFPLDEIRIRLIDTPGIGDTRGLGFSMVFATMVQYRLMFLMKCLRLDNTDDTRKERKNLDQLAAVRV